MWLIKFGFWLVASLGVLAILGYLFVHGDE